MGKITLHSLISKCQNYLVNICYAESIYFLDEPTFSMYYINILVANNSFFISVHHNNDKSLVIGYLHYNPKKSEILFSNKQYKENQSVANLIDIIKHKLQYKSIEFSKVIFKRRISIEKELNIFLITLLWSYLIKQKPEWTVQKRIDVLRKELSLTISTIIQRGQISFLDDVKQEANKYEHQLAIEKEAKTRGTSLDPEQRHALIENLKNEILIPNDFWLAFHKGIYPKELEKEYFNQLDKYSHLIGGIGYLNSIEKNGYIINFITIKNILFISIFEKGINALQLGNIYYNPFTSKKHGNLTYFIKRMRLNPVALEILLKLREICFQNKVTVKVRSFETGNLKFRGPIKTIWQVSKERLIKYLLPRFHY